MSLLAEFEELAGTGAWREEPVSLEEFVTSREHLGLPDPLYPRQLAAVKRLLGDDAKLVFADPLTMSDEERTRLYQLAVLLWGKGSGKDYLCSIVVCYLIYLLLCLRDPQQYLVLAPGEPIDVVNVAYNADQAKKVFFAKLKARIERWAWLRDRYNIVEAGRRVNDHKPGRGVVQINDDFIEFPGKIRAWSRHAQNESYEGLNIIAWIMDEASAFLSKLKRENAESIYQTLRTSAGSRFGMRWVGAIISYPRHADDFTMTKHREATLDPTLGVYADGPAKTWEINERTKLEPRVKIRDGLEVPASLANDFLSDPEEALGRYCCEPPMAREAFFRYPDRIWDSVQPHRRPLIDWEPVVIERDEDDGRTRAYRGIRITRWGKLPKDVKLFTHGDPGLVNDSFSLAIGYGVPATVMRKVRAGDVILDPLTLARLKIDPDDLIDWEIDLTRTVIAALIVWRPDPRLGMQVDLQNVEDTIFELRKHYPSIGHRARRTPGDASPPATITFDHWNSALTIQRMRARHLNVEDEAWSRPFQVDIYRNARAQFYNSLVTLPDAPSITSKDPSSPGAIYELERLEFIDGSKVDHPEGGSKDSADAIVRVIQHVTAASRSGFSHAHAHGHASMYESHGPFIPSSTPAIDPNRTPGIPQQLKDHDAQRQLERPHGELVPAKGTVNRRKFTTVQGRR